METGFHLSAAARHIGMPLSRYFWNRSKTFLVTFFLYFLGLQRGLRLGFFAHHDFTATYLHPIVVLSAASSILLCLLLIVPVSRWTIVFSAALFAHLLEQAFQQAPIPIIAVQSTYNFVLAGFSAIAIRFAIGDAEFRFDTVRRAMIFLTFAVAITPAIAALIPAAVTIWAGYAGEFWSTWLRISLSGALWISVLSPPIISVCREFFGEELPGYLTQRRFLVEGSVLLAVLTVLTWFAFSRRVATDSSYAFALILSFLSLLIAAALRFGPEGAGVVMMVVLLLGLRCGSMITDLGEHPFAMQCLMLVFYLPVFCLAVLARQFQALVSNRQQPHRDARSHHAKDDLAGRLIEVQENERARIARELHDDVNQQLAAFSMAIGGLKRRMPPNSHERTELELLQKRAINLTDEVRNLCHGLHSGVLQHVGLPAAVRSFCTEVQQKHHLKINVSANDPVEHIAPGVSLCLYRVLQEAIQNVVRHAHARTVYVDLISNDGGFRLTVADDGKGFSAARPVASRGLGLISIEERMRMVNGWVRIESQPFNGTTIRAWAPDQQASCEWAGQKSR